MNEFKELSLSDARAFIANCELGRCEAPLNSPVAMAMESMTVIDGAMEAAAQGTEEGGSGAVVEGGLMVFAPGTDPLIRQDVLDCMLLATMVADKAHDVENENHQWFKTFNKVLLNTGWPAHDRNYREYQSGGTSLTMDKLILEMLGAAITTAALPLATGAKMLQMATQLINGFSKKSGPLRVFEQKSKTQQGANFRVGACHQAEDGEVYITLATINFRIHRNMTSVLGFTWSDGEAKIYAANNGLIFNRRHYENVRGEVDSKLSNGARNNIANFEI